MGATETMNLYRCSHCGKITERPSLKQWVKSYCSKTGKDTRLTLIPPEQHKVSVFRAYLEDRLELISDQYIAVASEEGYRKITSQILQRLDVLEAAEGDS